MVVQHPHPQQVQVAVAQQLVLQGEAVGVAQPNHLPVGLLVLQA